ncbi:g649 [Coccomyxa viridis]|uniref:G649 protein n=1 Tax=Coccomyxa viridis TaxID=1274662 RepID=A0ABP1FG81_9CHLO
MVHVCWIYQSRFYMKSRSTSMLKNGLKAPARHASACIECHGGPSLSLYLMIPRIWGRGGRQRCIPGSNGLANEPLL